MTGFVAGGFAGFVMAGGTPGVVLVACAASQRLAKTAVKNFPNL